MALWGLFRTRPRRLRRGVAEVRALVRGAGDHGPRRPAGGRSAYLAERAERSKLATARSAAAAIAAACRAAGRADPTKTPLVADTLHGIARQHARQPRRAGASVSTVIQISPGVVIENSPTPL